MTLGKKIAVYAVAAVLAGGLGRFLWQVVDSRGSASGASVAVAVPDLSAVAARGKITFDAVCAACHGTNAAGSGKGPPLVNNIYNPGHHADAAFFRAVRLGSRQHHWRFGDMPPQPQVTDEQVEAIVQYVRELQRANGITRQPHQM